MGDLYTDPPNSRLFILCGKGVTEAELHKAFDKFGHIKDVWIVKDKSTMESKGVVYIKYSKSSEAARAMEEMNGKIMESGSKPIKVMIAHSREQGSRYDDDPDRVQRLFIVVNKSATEDELREHFKQFGDLDYISIVKNRTSGESKGVAYVKYYSAYAAARAYEECARHYKAVFARPRPEKNQSSSNFDNSADRSGHNNSGMSSQFNGGPSGGGRWVSGSSNVSGINTCLTGPNECRFSAVLHSSLREDQIYRLFDIAPGLVEICPQRMFYGMQKVVVEYNCPGSAAYAAEKINGLDYPPGHRVTIKQIGVGSSEDMSQPANMSGGMGKHDMNGGGTTTISNQELATLTAALAKAENIIKTAGLTGSHPGPTTSGLLKPNEASDFDPTYCSVRLPPPQPLAAPTDGPTHRLFIVCQPGLPSMYALRDIFGRFGNLVEVYTLHGKNCGYVTYSVKESADNAIKTLHLQEVCGMRIKVMVAEPPRPGAGPAGPGERKRIRLDEELSVS